MKFAEISGSRTGARARASEFEKFEREEGFRLPDVLSEHWRVHGGVVPGARLSFGEVTVLCLYSFEEALKSRIRMQDQIPAGYIPVGVDVASEPILVCMTDGRFGAVFSVKGVIHGDVDLQFECIADAFDDFLETLTQEVPEIRGVIEITVEGNMDDLDQFLAIEGQVDQVDGKGMSILDWAVLRADKGKVERVLAAKPANLERALEIAARGRSLELLELILGAGADPLTRSPTLGVYVARPTLPMPCRRIFNKYAMIRYGRELDFEVDPGNRTGAEVGVLELGGAGVNQNLKLENESQT